MPPATIAARGASKASASASARESAPPEQATRTRSPGSSPARLTRTACRTAATAGCGPTGDQSRGSVSGTGVKGPVVVVSSIRRVSAAVHPRQPGLRVRQLIFGRQRVRRCPDLVERGHPGLRDHCADEPRALLILLHLEVDAENPADCLLHPA